MRRSTSARCSSAARALLLGQAAGLLEDRGRLRLRLRALLLRLLECLALDLPRLLVHRVELPEQRFQLAAQVVSRRGDAERLARAPGRRQRPPEPIEERGKGHHHLSLPAGTIAHIVSQNACALSSAALSRGSANRKR